MLRLFGFICMFVATVFAKNCRECICDVESNCQPLDCRMDEGSLSCGYYQIKIDYFQDCGEIGKRPGESTEEAWKRCSKDKSCSEQCMDNYFNRYGGSCPTSMGDCEKRSRIHNGGPNGCYAQRTNIYWDKVRACCNCN